MSSSDDHKVHVPIAMDVLFGRGKGFQNHPGNVYLRKVVRSKSAVYEKSSKKEKTRISANIVEEIKSMPTSEGRSPRFLRPISIENQLWIESDDLSSRVKVGLLLRAEVVKEMNKDEGMTQEQTKQRKPLKDRQELPSGTDSGEFETEKISFVAMQGDQGSTSDSESSASSDRMSTSSYSKDRDERVMEQASRRRESEPDYLPVSLPFATAASSGSGGVYTARSEMQDSIAFLQDAIQMYKHSPAGLGDTALASLRQDLLSALMSCDQALVSRQMNAPSVAMQSNVEQMRALTNSPTTGTDSKLQHLLRNRKGSRSRAVSNAASSAPAASSERPDRIQRKLSEARDKLLQMSSTIPYTNASNTVGAEREGGSLNYGFLDQVQGGSGTYPTPLLGLPAHPTAPGLDRLQGGPDNFRLPSLGLPNNHKRTQSNKSSVKSDSLPSNFPLPPDFVPTQFTVVIGKGKFMNEFLGNQHLMKLAAKVLPEYSKASNKKEKSIITSSLVQAVRDSCPVVGAAFVRYQDRRFYEVCNGVAREKVGHILRDMLHHQNSKSSSKSKSALRRMQGLVGKEGKIV